MTFEQALSFAKQGNKIKRIDWNGPLSLDDGVISLTKEDLLAKDWYLYRQEKEYVVRHTVLNTVRACSRVEAIRVANGRLELIESGKSRTYFDEVLEYSLPAEE